MNLFITIKRCTFAILKKEDMEQTNKEIDLIELYQKIIKFTFRNFLTFLIFAIIGLLFGSAYYVKNSNKIKTNYLAEINFGPEKIIFSLSDNVIFNLKNKNYNILSKELNLHDSILSNITSLSVDTTGNLLNIEVEALSETDILSFSESLVNFFNHQSYLVENQRNSIHKTQNLLLKVDEEIANIEKVQEFTLSNNQNNNIFINQIENLHAEKIRLFEKRQKCISILRKKKVVRLINSDHNIFKNDISLLKILLISFLASIFFTFIYFFIRFSLALSKA